MKNNKKKSLPTIAKVITVIWYLGLIALCILNIIYKDDKNYYHLYGWALPTCMIVSSILYGIYLIKREKRKKHSDNSTDPESNANNTGEIDRE